MDPNREMDAEEWDFVKTSDALLVKSLHPTRSFAEAVDDYRRLEAEFVARAGDNEFDVVETRRRIAETILPIAHRKRPPFDACRNAWNELVRLGFTNIERQCSMTWFYADCCAYAEEPEEGLAVLEPLLAKLQRRLEEAQGAEADFPADFYEDQIKHLGKLRDKLKALRERGGPPT